MEVAAPPFPASLRRQRPERRLALVQAGLRPRFLFSQDAHDLADHPL